MGGCPPLGGQLVEHHSRPNHHHDGVENVQARQASARLITVVKAVANPTVDVRVPRDAESDIRGGDDDDGDHDKLPIGWPSQSRPYWYNEPDRKLFFYYRRTRPATGANKNKH